jgi:hypothetical protein
VIGEGSRQGRGRGHGIERKEKMVGRKRGGMWRERWIDGIICFNYSMQRNRLARTGPGEGSNWIGMGEVEKREWRRGRGCGCGEGVVVYELKAIAMSKGELKGR